MEAYSIISRGKAWRRCGPAWSLVQVKRRLAMVAPASAVLMAAAVQPLACDIWVTFGCPESTRDMYEFLLSMYFMAGQWQG